MFIPLEATGRRLGRAVVCRAVPLIGRPEDFRLGCPPGAVVLEVAHPPAPVFFYAPEQAPGGECYERLAEGEKMLVRLEWYAWSDYFLSAALTRPRATPPEIAELLGEDRIGLALALMRLWALIAEPDGLFPRLPRPAHRQQLRDLSLRFRRLPSELLAMSLPELMLNLHVLARQRGEPEGDQQADVRRASEELGIDVIMEEPGG